MAQTYTDQKAQYSGRYDRQRLQLMAQCCKVEGDFATLPKSLCTDMSAAASHKMTNEKGHLNGFPEIPRVCRVLKGVCSNQHHIQRDATAPHICNLPIVVLPREHLHAMVCVQRSSAMLIYACIQTMQAVQITQLASNAEPQGIDRTRAALHKSA